MAAGVPGVAAVLREEDSAGGCKMLGILLVSSLLLVSALFPGCNCCCLLGVGFLMFCCVVMYKVGQGWYLLYASGALGMQCVPRGFRKWMPR